MEIIDRKENPLLNRVELIFQWDHPNEPTPSRAQMVDAAAKAEPGSDRKLVFVKNVDTRFGMSRTSGIALVYGSQESASIEPEYVIERHKGEESPAKEQGDKVEEEAQEENDEGGEA